jgi:hypothetical protein
MPINATLTSARSLRSSLCCYAGGEKFCDCKYLGDPHAKQLTSEHTGCCEARDAVSLISQIAEGKPVKRSEYDRVRILIAGLLCYLTSRRPCEDDSGVLHPAVARRLIAARKVDDFLMSYQPTTWAEEEPPAPRKPKRPIELSVTISGDDDAERLRQLRAALQNLAALGDEELLARLRRRT